MSYSGYMWRTSPQKEARFLSYAACSSSCFVFVLEATREPIEDEGRRRRTGTNQRSPKPQRASVLVGLLWCVAILSVVVVGVLHRARIDLQVAKNYGDRIQAHYLALAGIERAKALIFEDAGKRKRRARNQIGRASCRGSECDDVV